MKLTGKWLWNLSRRPLRGAKGKWILPEIPAFESVSKIEQARWNEAAEIINARMAEDAYSLTTVGRDGDQQFTCWSCGFRGTTSQALLEVSSGSPICNECHDLLLVQAGRGSRGDE